MSKIKRLEDGDIFRHEKSREKFTNVEKPKYKLLVWHFTDLDIYHLIAGTSKAYTKGRQGTLEINGSDVYIITNNKYYQKMLNGIGYYHFSKNEQVERQFINDNMIKVAKLNRNGCIKLKNLIDNYKNTPSWKWRENQNTTKIIELIASTQKTNEQNILDVLDRLGISC